MSLALVPEDLDTLVTTNQAAETCGLSGSTIRSWVQRGHLHPTGLDERGRPLYRVIDVLRAARDTRRRGLGYTRSA